MRHLPKKSEIELLLHRARQDSDILAVMLFGSFARKESRADSDIDICLVLAPRRQSHSSANFAHKRLQYAKFDLDIHLFQQLPLYIRSRVLKEGEVLFTRNEALLYDVALRTARSFEDFKPIYQAYLKEVEHAG